MAHINHLRAGDYRAMPWKNGKGTTTELAVGHAGDAAGAVGSSLGDFAWRLSLADVPESGPFSDFAGIDRTIMMVEGAGMTLDFGPHGRAVVEQPFEPVAFQGEWPTRCSLHDGPIRDLNVMVARARMTAAVEVLRLSEDPVTRRLEGSTLLCHALAGEAVVRVGEERPPATLGFRETLRIELDRPAPLDLTVRGAGAVLLVVSLRPVSQVTAS